MKHKSHNVTKFVRNFSSDYLCHNCNTSYPTKKSLVEDHDLDKTLIVICIKRKEETFVF